MIHRLISEKRWTVYIPLFIFLVALLLRCWNLAYYLPNLYHSDEPHHMNIAAHFGTGDLNPHDFKYPTFWAYILAGLLGLLYALGTFLHVVHSSDQFAQAYFYNPTVFYLSARFLSAVFLSLVPVLFYVFGLKFRSRSFSFAIAFLTIFSPILLELGRDTTPVGLMVFLFGGVLFFFEKLMKENSLKAYGLTGCFVGLAISTHFIAAPIGVVLLIGAVHNWSRSTPKLLFVGVLSAALAFFAGSPYILLDFASALGYVRGHGEFQLGLEQGARYFFIRLMNNSVSIIKFMDPLGLGFGLLLYGFLRAAKPEKKIFAVWCAPALVFFPLFCFFQGGGTTRYLLSFSILLFVPAAHGLAQVWTDLGTPVWRKVVFMIPLTFLLLRPFVAARVKEGLPDTRTEAKEWILKNIPMETKIFTTGPFDGPDLIMCRSQVERLLEKTTAFNHPRKEYYRILLQGHPGGGYDISRLKLSFDETLDLRNRTEASFQAQDWVDPTQNGVSELIERGITYVVFNPSFERGRHGFWIQDLRRRYRLIARFSPQDHKMAGPTLEIYQYGS